MVAPTVYTGSSSPGYAAARLDLLVKQVATVLGTARTAEHLDLAVLDGNNGLDGKHLAKGTRRSGNAPAATQILKSVQ